MALEISFCDPETKTLISTMTINEQRFIVNFRRTPGYQGNFGFDWMRDEFKSICSNFHELKKEYETFHVDVLGDYYIPWLSVSPKQEDKDPDTQLQLEVVPIDKRWSKSTIEFKCPPGISVEPKTLEIKKGMAPPVVTINCSSGHGGGTIEVVTKESKADPYPQTVGKLNLVPHKEHPLHIHVVPLIRKSHAESDEKLLRGRSRDIENLLTKGCLRQAFIEVTTLWEGLLVDDLQLQANGYMGKRRDLPKNHPSHKDINFREESKFDTQYLNEIVLYDSKPIYDLYQEKIGDKVPKGIVIYLAVFAHPIGAAGHGVLDPTTENKIIMYDLPNNPNEILGQTIPHEIGHILGLDHIFEKTLKPTDREKEVDYIKEQKKDINKFNVELNINMNKEAAADILNQYIVLCEENIKKSEARIELFDYLDNLPQYIFIKKETDNLMDYNSMYGTKLNCFYKWQWDRMQHEIKKYHS